MKRINFIRNTSFASLGVSFLGVYACKEVKKEDVQSNNEEEIFSPFFELSLAQWSMHKMIREDGVDPYSFAEKAKNWGFTGLEYVSQLYNPELENAGYSEAAMANFVSKSNSEAKKHGMKNLLIMIDGQGNLAVDDEVERNETVEKHKKWVDAAQAMGCHSIRVNLNGSSDPEQWKNNSIDGLTKLATYAKEKSINILVENHGGLSSNGALHAEVMAAVNMDNCGTLPDFGNFCIERKPDSCDCVKEYDKDKGVKDLMAFAKDVSYKSTNVDDEGYETGMDHVDMLTIHNQAGQLALV